MSTYYVAGFPYSSELYHHGIKGQRWGIRRYQNEDGTLTRAGAARYGSDAAFESHQKFKAARKERMKTDIKYGLLGRHLTKEGKKNNENYKNAKAEYKKAMKDSKESRTFLKAANTNYKRGYRVDPETGKYDTKSFVKKHLASAAGGLAVSALGSAINKHATSEGAKFVGGILKYGGKGWATGKAIGTALGVAGIGLANKDASNGYYDIPTYKKGTR